MRHRFQSAEHARQQAKQLLFETRLSSYSRVRSKMHRVFNAVMAAEREIGQIGRALQSVGQRVESAFQSRDEVK